MSFFKTAKTLILGFGDVTGFQRTASLCKDASFYETENKLIITSIKEKLKEVASTYKISADPSDYIYVAVRALTADAPNENWDAFSESELLRFTSKHGCKVYQTFNLKPHHVNHRSADPSQARGVILDSHYNNKNSHHFPEIFIAVDKTKDKRLAEGISSGELTGFSMGCSADYTICSICNHKASSPSEFCNHIRFYKGKEIDGKVAFEWCEGVVFEEESSVDDPADKNAITQEVILANKKNELEKESEFLALNTKLNSLNINVNQILSTITSGDAMNKNAEKRADDSSTSRESDFYKKIDVGEQKEEEEEEKEEERSQQDLEDYKEKQKEEDLKERTKEEYGIMGAKNNPYSKLIAERKEAIDRGGKDYWTKYQGDYGSERVKDIKKKKIGREADKGQLWDKTPKGSGDAPKQFSVDKKKGNPPSKWKFADIHFDVEVFPISKSANPTTTISKYYLIAKSAIPVYLVIDPKTKASSSKIEDVSIEIVRGIAETGLIRAMQHYNSKKLKSLYDVIRTPSFVEESPDDLRGKVKSKPSKGIEEGGVEDVGDIDRGKVREKTVVDDGMKDMKISSSQRRADLVKLMGIMDKAEAKGFSDEKMLELIKLYIDKGVTSEEEIFKMLETQIEAGPMASKKVKAVTEEAQEFIGKKIKKLMEEGYEQQQAIAVAYNMAREEGYDVPEKQGRKKDSGVTDRALRDFTNIEKVQPEQKESALTDGDDDLSKVKRDEVREDNVYAGGKDDLDIKRDNTVDLKANRVKLNPYAKVRGSLHSLDKKDYGDDLGAKKEWTETNSGKWEAIQKASKEAMKNIIEAEVKKDSLKEMAEFRRSFRERFVRALKLAFERSKLNLIDNELKIAFADTLLTPSDDYVGMDEGLSSYLIEESFKRGGTQFIASLLKEAEEFIDMPEESFLKIEEDVKKLNLVTPVVSSNDTGNAGFVDEVVERAARSNPVFTPKESLDKHENLKGVFRNRLA